MLSHSKSHQMTQSQVTRHMEGHKRFWKNNVIQCVKHMLTLRHTHGVKIVDGGLYFIFLFHFYFTLLFFSF